MATNTAASVLAALSSLLLHWLHVVAWAFSVGAAYKQRLLNKTLFRLQTFKTAGG